ncbi:MAG TPA: VOC family protein [Vicinamibacterales bacterium]|nr:VOC family protein [Vicinamibacterales bacterium]
MTAPIDRRGFLASIPALMLAPKVFAQAKPTLTIRGFNHVTLVVSDLKQSIDFYQGLFGLARERTNRTADASLRIGPGAGIDLTTNRPDRTPRIDHYCYGVERFSVDGVLKTLAAHGVQKRDEAGPMTVQVNVVDGAQRVMAHDPDGITFQLQDPSYCSGSGPLGNQCGSPEPSPKKGLIALKGYSHVTVFSTDAQRSTTFYRELFGAGIRSFQGPTAPTVAIGSGVEFAMYTGGGGGRAGAPPRPASINHFSFNMEHFDPEQVIKALESYGIKPREGQTGPVGPMRHYISMRMENRGGAKEGTPELYFTDPDGILVQIQDTSYCGGSGVLGNVCPPVSA